MIKTKRIDNPLTDKKDMEKYRKQFDEFYYATTNGLSDNELWEFCRSDTIMKFVLKLIQSAIHKTEERMIEEIEKLKKPRKIGSFTVIHPVYNRAIKDVIKILNHSKHKI